MAKAKTTTRKRVARAVKRSKHEMIEQKISDTESLDYSRWSPRRATEHIIAAGRVRLLEQKLYDFPAYCRFPYNKHENAYVILNLYSVDKIKSNEIQCSILFLCFFFYFFASAHDPNNLPFKFCDDDAPAKLRNLMNGKLAYYDMRSEQQNHVLKFLSKQCVSK